VSAHAVLAVDVGSSAARAGVFSREGRQLGAASHAFEVHRPQPDHAEHDALQIWQTVGQAVRGALAAAGVGAGDIAGLCFDATCSLVLLDERGAPVTASTTGADRWNVVMWADHRATAEAARINATGHKVLDYVGGAVSPEMELPKLMWLQRHLPQAWARYGRAFDLADWLTWQATGVAAVSACTVTCKWGYLNHEAGWPDDLLRELGLADLRERLRLPARAQPVGGRAGTLTRDAAAALGLQEGTPVGVGLIDAHAGALGVLAGHAGDLDRRLALIAGTSNCHMALSPAARPVPGVWGPYYGAVMPDLWLNEGGQSATGALLDHVLDSHAASAQLGPDRHAAMARLLLERRAADPAYASDLLVLPDFHGNRSPLADPALRGSIHGLDLDASLEGLARLYHAAAVGIAYGTRHIVQTLNARGYAISRLHLTGGHAKSPLLVQVYADATGCDVVLPRESDGVLLGTALAAAAAAGVHANLAQAGRAMVADGGRVSPQPATAAVHERGWRAFGLMVQQRQALRDVLAA
jgi:FGGY-family pentulose kinase